MLSVGAAVVASPCVAISSVVAWPLRATPAVERTVIGVGIIELAETVARAADGAPPVAPRGHASRAG